MNVIWIVISMAIAGAVAKAILRARTHSSDSDLGSVSARWIAEHRLSSDAQR
jgi:hypothetical protein